METNEHFKFRIYAVMAVMCAAGLVLIGQLVRWQIIEHSYFEDLAAREHRDELIIPARRGEVRDRNGHLLAVDVVEYDISVSPQIISDPYATADRLSRLLDTPRDELLKHLTSEDPWVPIAYAVPQSVGETIIDWDIVGLQAEPRTKRVYPEGSMAAHVMGFVNGNGRGFYGVEGYYQNMLSGKPGLQTGERSPFGEMIPLGVSRFVPPVGGTTLYLTIDRTVQFLVERELQDAVRQ